MHTRLYRWSIISLLLLLALPLSAQQNQSVPCESPVDLVVGERGRVSAETRLNLRPQPTTRIARSGVVAPGDNFTVLAGPTCADTFVWWQVQLDDDSEGWLAAADNDTDALWLEPRGTLVIRENAAGADRRFIRTADGHTEPEGCMRPPDDYEQVQLGYATLNRRTLFMLDNAQRIYETLGGEEANFRQLITQGSYNPGGVAASFGTHDAGGAVDISVKRPSDFSVMEEEIPLMLEAMRIAGFAAWLRDDDELFDGSIIHIHAIAIGDDESSEIAQQQISSEFGYLSGYNGLPPEDGAEPIPDRYGDPVLCQWMLDDGFEDLRDEATDNAES